MQTHTHRIKRSYRLSQPLEPPTSKRPFKCRCQLGSPRIICPSCTSQLGLKSDSGVSGSWVRINNRAGGRCLVDIIGGADPHPDLALLKAWGVPSDAIHFEGIKAIEQYAAIERKDAPRVVDTIRRFLVVPCTNQVMEGRWINKPDRNPEEGAGWSHGAKRVLFQGELVQTTLSRFECGLSYYLTVYQIEETPDYPAKIEVIALAPTGVWFPEERKDTVRKAMTQFILGMCQAAGVAPVPTRMKMQGESYTVKGRGLQIAPDAIRRAAALADTVDRDRADYSLVRRETLLAAMCSCVGRPLSQNTIAELLNGVDGKRALHRTVRPFRYSWIPPTPMMARLQRVLSKKLRMAFEDAAELSDDEQVTDDSLEVVPPIESPSMVSVAVEVTSGPTSESIEEEDEFRGLDADLLREFSGQGAA